MPSWKCLLAEHREYHDHPDKYLDSLTDKPEVYNNELMAYITLNALSVQNLTQFP